MKTFRLRWEVRGKQHLTEMRAATAGDARQAFNAYRLPGVLLTSVEPVEPDAAIPPVSTQPPGLPLSPLTARRKTITDLSRFGALARRMAEDGGSRGADPVGVFGRWAFLNWFLMCRHNSI